MHAYMLTFIQICLHICADIHVCVFLVIHTHLHVCPNTHTHVCTYIFNVCIYTCKFIFTHPCSHCAIFTHIHACSHSHKYILTGGPTCMHMFMFPFTHICIYSLPHIYVLTFTPTHMHSHFHTQTVSHAVFINTRSPSCTCSPVCTHPDPTGSRSKDR